MALTMTCRLFRLWHRKQASKSIAVKGLVGIKLIVGLGNPGQDYDGTRHNAGFWFLDGLVSHYGGVWGVDAKFHGLLATIDCAGCRVLLLKPQTYMNRSGQAVGAILRYYKLAADELLVVHDELDLEVGVIRLKKNGGHAGHNGLRDIIAHLGGNGFYRLRIGIGRPAVGRNVADYVLSAPSREGQGKIGAAMDGVCGDVALLLAGEYGAFMSRHN